MINRNILSIYCSGEGIEIGAYHNPFPVDRSRAKVVYVDKWPYEKLIEMRNADPNLRPDMPIAPVDIIDDGEYLKKIPDNSQDFVISSHQLEHCKSPLTAIENHVRVLKRGGRVIYAVPDKRYTFDKERVATDWGFIYAIYSNSDNEKDIRDLIHQCYDEYYLLVDKITDREIRFTKIKEAIRDNRDIHFHVWDEKALVEMLTRASILFHFELELFSRAGHENFVMLKKL